MSDSELYTRKVPRHVAIIMDGNGRWARKRGLPRFAGHKAGMDSVRAMVKVCLSEGIECLTLFAFSSENWRRPAEEVGLLMNLFMVALDHEVKKLHKHGVRLRIIGERSAFAPELQQRIAAAEQLTAANTALTLIIAANYGGRWDITQATRNLAERVARGELAADAITPQLLESCLSLAGLPEPDLFIRTGGEQRISNFLLWQLAYTELYFTPLLWPSFDEQALAVALESFAGRQRRFGRTGEQVEQMLDA
jgi:undecaprenyl diphosphate synthase